MSNVSSLQKEVINDLRKLDPNVEICWDETRGVASSVRGKLQRATVPEVRENSKKGLPIFLDKFGPLFGPQNLSCEELILLQKVSDELGWTHLIFQHELHGKYARLQEVPPILEVYGAKLVAHFDAVGTLIEVQSSLWREMRVTGNVCVRAEDVRAIQLKALEGAYGFASLRDRLEKKEPLFPLTVAPRLVVYPWKGQFPLVWIAYGYGVVERAEGQVVVTYGQLFLDATTGEKILFAPMLTAVETSTTGSGLAVTPLSGSKTSRTLNIVRQDNTNTYRLKDLTHARPIITFDPACSTAYNNDDEIEPAIRGGTLPCSEDIDAPPGDHNWNRQPSATVTRDDAQLPEVDAHHFAKLQYEWYKALAGRIGWDNGNYSDPPVPNQTINVLAHCYPPPTWGLNQTTFNSYHWCRIVNVAPAGQPAKYQWTSWLAFMDGDGITYDYPTGARWMMGHEYQHAITHFSFKDGNGFPGLTYQGWFAAVHEGLSDVFGSLSTEDWLPCREVSHLTPQQVFRNLVYPRDPNAYDNNNLDHFADRSFVSSIAGKIPYQRGTILAHSAYLMSEGGVHQRVSNRSPELIPVYGLGRENVGGVNFYKAARIWYRALSYYFSTFGALSGIPSNDENAFRTLRDGCVKAAEDLYGKGSPEQLNTILAFYATGLHPVDKNYGADVTFLRWGISWSLSRDFVGLTCPDYSSLDLFINNGGLSEWNALINDIDVATGQPTQYENTIYCRVRNVGDEAANNVEVTFQYAKASTAPVAWLDVKDKNGNTVKLSIGTLGAGQSNFPDSAQNSPPASASVKWYIPPLAANEVVDHFCLRANVTASNDVNPHNNEVQSNIAYTAYSVPAPAKAAFLVGNPLKEETIKIDLRMNSMIPKSWRAHIIEQYKRMKLKPREERTLTFVLEMQPGADRVLEAPFDGDVRGYFYGYVSGPFSGSLTNTGMEANELRGRLSAVLPNIGSVVGLFNGEINFHTGQLRGKFSSAHPYPTRKDLISLDVKAYLRPWRRVEISQWHDANLLGGITFQIQVPWNKKPYVKKLPSTGTVVNPNMDPDS